MAWNTNSPQVTALILAVEKKFAHPIVTRSDFSALVADVECITHEHISENTLRRLYGKIHGYDTVYTRTLDVLSVYVGFRHFDAFIQSLKNAGPESDLINGVSHIKVEDLIPGDRIRIAWLPDRECIVEFVGGKIFKAISTQNSTLQVGDTFECGNMLKGYPLFVDNLVHGGEICQRYSMGLATGLTSLEKL